MQSLFIISKIAQSQTSSPLWLSLIDALVTCLFLFYDDRENISVFPLSYCCTHSNNADLTLPRRVKFPYKGFRDSVLSPDAPCVGH